ncbi:MAG: hypothetical protein HND44_13400 [Chloroflexi bacterium]|nr:hypothetical protein [Ardenticatenaceae bacterium]MBL1129472.1 hypothetical protein [Chloroflexota bacterium]NOG35552.1 hypothetical protein [Chloroflexota bacterium]GIK55691.1 MAG: hypothetical protein BroJett015_13540 [Chloroflexota bacterium]
MNRLEWILGIVLVVLLLAVAALSLVFWFRPQGSTIHLQPAANTGTVIAQQAAVVAPTSVFTGETSLMAYGRAQSTAAAWQPDARLLNAQATWPQLANSQQLRDGKTTWGFTFYSPAAQEIAVISVVEDAARIVSQGPYQQTGNLLNATGWNLDSQEAITTMLAAGGSQFFSETGVASLTMMLTLDDSEGDGRMEWQMNLIAPQHGRGLKMRIDATSGEILENKTVP